MNKKLTPRYVIIGLVLLWAVYSLWPTVQLQTLSEAEVETMREEGNYGALESKAIKQGLDLKGGMYICLVYTSPSSRDATPARMPSSASNTTATLTSFINAYNDAPDALT